MVPAARWQEVNSSMYICMYAHTISLVYCVLCLLQVSKYSKWQAFVLPGDINKLLRIKACSVSVYLTHNHASQIKGDNMHVSASAS